MNFTETVDVALSVRIKEREDGLAKTRKLMPATPTLMSTFLVIPEALVAVTQHVNSPVDASPAVQKLKVEVRGALSDDGSKLGVIPVGLIPCHA